MSQFHSSRRVGVSGRSPLSAFRAILHRRRAIALAAEQALGQIFEPLEARQLLSGTLSAAAGQKLEVMAGQSFTDAVATFSSTRTDAQASDFSASINYGDGNTDAGAITADGTDSSGNLLFAVSPLAGYTYSAVGANTATVDVADAVTSDTVEASVAVASDGLFSVRPVNLVINNGAVTSTVKDNPAYGTPDANGFITVAADSEVDAIDKGIVVTAISNTQDHTEYDFFGDPNYSVTPSAANDNLNWVINLQNGANHGTAAVQSRPELESATISDANNTNNTVTPPVYVYNSNPSTIGSLLAVQDPSTGYAKISVSALLGVADSSRDSELMWTVSSTDGTIGTGPDDADITAQGTFASGSLADIKGGEFIYLKPGQSNTFTVFVGYDMNDDGHLANSGIEVLRAVHVNIVQLGSVTVSNAAGNGQNITVSDSSSQGLTVSQDSNETATMTITPHILPGGSQAGSEVIYDVLDSSGAEVVTGNFFAGPASFTLAGGGAIDLGYTVRVGVDLNGTGSLLTNPVLRTIQLDVAKTSIAIDPQRKVAQYDPLTNTLTITRPQRNGVQVNLPVQLQSNGKPVAGQVLDANITTSQPPNPQVAPPVDMRKTNKTLDGNFSAIITVSASTTPGTYTVVFTDLQDTSITQTMTLIVN